MVFPSKAKDISVKLNDNYIENVHHCRYLGILIDDMLTWSQHINAIYSKLMKYIGIFYKIRNKLPHLILKKIFILHLCIHMFYMVQILVMSTYRNW